MRNVLGNSTNCSAGKSRGENELKCEACEVGKLESNGSTNCENCAKGRLITLQNEKLF